MFCIMSLFVADVARALPALPPRPAVLYVDIQSTSNMQSKILGDFEAMDSKASKVEVDLEETLRVVQRGGASANGDAGAGSLEQLRFTKCRLQVSLPIMPLLHVALDILPHISN